MRSLMHPQCFLNALGKIHPISQPDHPYAARNPPVTLPYRDTGGLRERYAPDTGGVAEIGDKHYLGLAFICVQLCSLLAKPLGGESS